MSLRGRLTLKPYAELLPRGMAAGGKVHRVVVWCAAGRLWWSRCVAFPWRRARPGRQSRHTGKLLEIFDNILATLRCRDRGAITVHHEEADASAGKLRELIISATGEIDFSDFREFVERIMLTAFHCLDTDQDGRIAPEDMAPVYDAFGMPGHGHFPVPPEKSATERAEHLLPLESRLHIRPFLPRAVHCDLHLCRHLRMRQAPSLQ